MKKTIIACRRSWVLCAELVGYTKSPFFDNDPYLHNHFEVSVRSGFKTIKFDFYGSAADYDKGVNELEGNNLIFAFYCFLSDATAAKNTYEDFCHEFGYQPYDYDSWNEDEDGNEIPYNEKARKVYDACKESLKKYESLTTIGIYDLINKLQENYNL